MSLRGVLTGTSRTITRSRFAYRRATRSSVRPGVYVPAFDPNRRGPATGVTYAMCRLSVAQAGSTPRDERGAAVAQTGHGELPVRPTSRRLVSGLLRCSCHNLSRLLNSENWVLLNDTPCCNILHM